MDLEEIHTEHAKRLAAADSLLPHPEKWSGDVAGTTLTTVGGPDGVRGVALATVSEVASDSNRALWRPRVEYRLDARLAGGDPGAALANLLTQWEGMLADAPPGDWDTAAVVPRASRDTVGSAELLRHGFTASRVLAARPADRLGSGPPSVPGVSIRHAERRDLDTIVQLELELRRYDAQFGLVTLRDGEAELIEAEARPLLDDSDPSLWIAELYGKPLGLLHVQLPPAAEWIAEFTAARRVGYLTSLNVAEEARSTGVGTALAGHAHQLFDEAGVEVVLLHHALANPRSTPFWCAQGYRPLWTYWYRRPALR